MGLKEGLIRINTLFLNNINRLLPALIILSSCILLLWGFSSVPQLLGDGNEYVGMTISLLNHGSPDFRSEDTELQQKIYDNNNIIRPITLGYRDSLKGTLEASHFWFYSLIVLPLFLIFHAISSNQLAAFQITNILLLIATIFIIYRCDRKVSAKHFWYIALILSSPVLLYLKWAHAEVLTFCFVSLSLFFGFLSDKRNYYLAVLFSALASLQNPPVIILTLFLVIIGWRNYSYGLKNLACLILISSISCVPYIYSYYFFNTINPQIFIGAADWHYISLDRIIGLFFDLNAGIISYLPVVLVLSILLIPYSYYFQRDYRTLILWGIILVMAVGCTTTINWNSGMMYLFRYAVWIIPLLIVTVVFLSEYSDHHLISILLIIAVLSTGMITIGCLLEDRTDNYIMFNSISKEMMVVAPSFYNPSVELFGERATNYEGPYEKALPIIVTYNGEIRKILTDERNLDIVHSIGIHPSSDELRMIYQNGIGYINMDTNPSLIPVNNSQVRILGRDYYNYDKTNLTTQLIDYYSISGIINENGENLNFINDELFFGIISSFNILRTMQFTPKINSSHQTMNVYVGKALQARTEIDPDIMDCRFNMSLKKGLNLIRITVAEKN